TPPTVCAGRPAAAGGRGRALAVRILYANHTGSRSGAENAMLRLLAGLPPEHDRAVACPQEGGWKDALLERGIEQFDLPSAELSVNLHPLQTARGLARLLQPAPSLFRIRPAFRPDPT